MGTGDYEHLTIDLSAMLLHQFHSLYHYFGQGFESSHKLHRQLFSRATNHDASGAVQSLEQRLLHWYSTHLLGQRYSFREAKKCLISGKKHFHYRGCGWSAKDKIPWCRETKNWVFVIDDLFTKVFGDDFVK